MNRLEIVNPDQLGRHTGFSHGILAPAGGRVLFVAGQTAPGAGDLVDQFGAALERTLAVVREAGGRPEHVTRMTVYVTDMATYRTERPRLAGVWRASMGQHYPAMALVEVRSLVDPNAVVEIEATAVLPEEP
ncbi:MAG TPA: RidA family protein [Gemmatimonadota bacterium]|nr:RidA family protein [Gemmatimonadota bacterium]